MWMTNRTLRFGVFIFIMTEFLGCATPGSNIGTNNAPVIVYHSKPPAGIENINTAKADLAGLLQNGRRIGIRFGSGKYYSDLDLNLYANQPEVLRLLQGINFSGLHFYYNSDRKLQYFEDTSIVATDNRIEVSPRISFFYAQLPDSPISVTKSDDTDSYIYAIHFQDRISFFFDNLADARKFADDLFFIHQALKREHDERLAIFEAKAAQYRELTVKPRVSEEQRKYIVQANALNRLKDYDGAIKLYLKAVDLDPVAYPNAYFNLAMLSAQLHWFDSAISYMKQYLLLVPDAKDARSAQDKIYEWEIMMKK
jgi:tetratricopeptide (TPR) repeat protein